MNMAPRATVNISTTEQNMTIPWQECRQTEVVEMIKKHLTWISFTVACAIAMLISVSAFAGAGQPIVKVGEHCPSGYRVSGEYCVPPSDSTASPAIEKKRTCPTGYRRNGFYCEPRSDTQSVPHSIEKNGPCPSGYKTSGEYCVEKSE